MLGASEENRVEAIPEVHEVLTVILEGDADGVQLDVTVEPEEEEREMGE